MLDVRIFGAIPFEQQMPDDLPIVHRQVIGDIAARLTLQPLPVLSGQAGAERQLFKR